jgi:type VI secretion system secreted protein Hcp
MSDATQFESGRALSSRRGLIRAATGVAAAGLVAGALLEARPAAAAALGTTGRFFVSIEGSRQGKFKGEATEARRTDWIVGLGFHYEVTSPRDVATGMATGQRQHHPIVVTKEWGAASPQLFQALVTNEVLKSVLFEFVGVDRSGMEVVYHTIRLTDASITNIEQYIHFNAAGHQNADDQRALEDVAFVFRRIEIENKDGKTLAVDDSTGRIA